MSDDFYDSDDYYPPSPPLTPVTISYSDSSLATTDGERAQEAEPFSGLGDENEEDDYLSSVLRDETNGRSFHPRENSRHHRGPSLEPSPPFRQAPARLPSTGLQYRIPSRERSPPPSQNLSTTASSNSDSEPRLTHTPLPTKDQLTAAFENSGRNRKSRRRGQRRWDLPMLLKGKEVVACPDSGAEANFISKETAISLGLNSDIDEEYSEAFVLGNGKHVMSIGRVVAECSFAKDPKKNYTCLFHIFRTLVVPLIMGAKFLRETETFTAHKRRLQERAWSPNLPLRVMHISGAKEQMDLMSKTYAEGLSGRPLMPLESDAEIQFADGSTAELAGQVPSRFSLHESGSWTLKWFYVLIGLPCDVLLGDETLEDIDAFNLESSTCVSEGPGLLLGLHIILWLKRPEQRLATALEKLSRPSKRQRSTDVELGPRAYFSSPALQELDPQFKIWWQEMRHPELPDAERNTDVPTFITEDQLLEFDNWEAYRRSKLNFSVLPVEEADRRSIYDRCRNMLFEALKQGPIDTPSDVAIINIPYTSHQQTIQPPHQPTTHSIPAAEPPSPLIPLSNPIPQNGFRCKHPGCTAAPFQTQYLLNCHSKVHSSNRPHYCPVKGCSRGIGGMGFKRRNEMIRHGLVHDALGYICPFCPDREHKYPRPDNLQRHVRIHHADKDKGDRLLQSALAQGAEG